MTPVDQLILHDEDNPTQMGDCLRASVASALDLDPSDVPHFVQDGYEAGDTDDDGLVWFDVLRAFLRSRGLDVLWCPVEDLDEYLPWSAMDVCMLSGPSPRGPFSHIVVGKPDGTVLHDPHPTRAGIEGVESIVLFANAEDVAEDDAA